MDLTDKTAIQEHRKRLVERFENEGLENFTDAECIELLLQYAVPAKCTAELSQKLLKYFGTFHGVMDADMVDLLRVSGMSECSATLLQVVPRFIRNYAFDKMGNIKVFDTVEKVGEYCVNRYFGETDEILGVMLLDKNNRLIGFKQLQRGSLGSASLNLEKLADYVFSYDSPAFILVHNHNGGSVRPSMPDIDTTSYVMDYFASFGRVLVEHIIVCNNRYLPLVKYMEEHADELYGGGDLGYDF